MCVFNTLSVWLSLNNLVLNARGFQVCDSMWFDVYLSCVWTILTRSHSLIQIVWLSNALNRLADLTENHLKSRDFFFKWSDAIANHTFLDCTNEGHLFLYNFFMILIDRTIQNRAEISIVIQRMIFGRPVVVVHYIDCWQISY